MSETTGNARTPDQTVLDAVLDSWDRNNAILLNLLQLVPEARLGWQPHTTSPSLGKLFTHMDYVRRVFVLEDAPEFALAAQPGEWTDEHSRARLIEMLHESAIAVREAVKARWLAGRGMDVHYDHPILMLQHLIWHEGYHHGQIKLALKLAGQPLDDDSAGPATWDLWMEKGLW
jgi:uncharacterized damage-inducible protein DinB